MARQVELRPITNYEGNRLLCIVRRSNGSVVTWRRAQMVLLAAQAMPVSQIAKVTFTGQDRVRDVIHNFNADGFDALYHAIGAAGRQRSRCRNASGGLPTLGHTACGICRPAYDLSRDRLYGHSKRRGEFLVFCRYLRSLYPSRMRIGLVLDNASTHLSTRQDRRVGQWAAASNVGLAYTPTNASFLNRIEGTSPRCATSRWTAPTTPATLSRPA